MPSNSLTAHKFIAIGVMSGTSLDGLDLCLSEFSNINEKWYYKIVKAITVEYDNELRESLENAFFLSGQKLARLNASYGKWIAQRINEFLSGTDLHIDIIGSHGHTVFHNPSAGFTTQIGSGAHIASHSGIGCVCDFRSSDIARGGQGAPLVPIGDELLFANYDFCLNIGGIANISYKTGNERLAFDICPANMGLNLIANHLGFQLDEDGMLGQKGNIDTTLLNNLNLLDFYKTTGAKSLGREWFDKEFKPQILKNDINPYDILRTLYEHIAIKISECFDISPKGSVLVTGGGANNRFLIELIKSKCTNNLVVPKKSLVNFKEALIFGFLAVLYLNKISACLSSVTGASSNSIGGCLYY